MSDQRLRRPDPSERPGLLDALLDLYAEAFAAPPWSTTPDEVAAHRPRLAEHLGRDDLELLVAETRDDAGTARLVGAGYGWSGRPASTFDFSVAAAVPDGVVADHMGLGSIAVVELMVAPDAQGGGLGRDLLRELVAGRPGWLVTHPDGAATRLYDREGWRVAGTVTTADGVPLEVRVKSSTA